MSRPTHSAGASRAATDPRERFTAAVEDYRRHRPSYPAALVDWVLADRPPGSRVADVGCGTGISTRLFAGRGCEVVGVDPNEPMLRAAHAAGGARYVRGQAGATGLAGASVDLVTVAQAFHWFEPEGAIAEFGRILKPGGRCAVFWNLREGGAFPDEYEALLRQRSSEYASVPKGGETFRALRAWPRLRDVREAAFPHEQVLDREGLLGRARSSSYVAHGVADLDGFQRALEALFDRHQRDGRVALRYRCCALSFVP